MTSAAPFFDDFPFENKVNATERGAAEVMIERVTEISISKLYHIINYYSKQTGITSD